jgi:endonuclease-3
MTEIDIHAAFAILRETMPNLPQPLIDGMAAEERNPFRVLIATILSLRTKDTLTAVVAPRLFAEADTPESMLELGEPRIAELIYPVGFYNTKAHSIVEICRRLIEQYSSQVPADLDQLLSLPGVGRKTANLTLTIGFALPGICVDTHVHRISNIWGYVKTKTPDDTELALRAKLPAEYWIPINGLLVTLGQQICHPTSPRCSICPLTQICPRIGITRSR